MAIVDFKSPIPANDTGKTARFYVVRQSDAQFWNVLSGAFEAYNSANYTTTKYLIAMTETGATGYWRGTFPATITSATVVNVVAVFDTVAGTPAVSDPSPANATYYWDGTDILPYSAADAKKFLGTAYPTPDTAGYPKVTVKNGTGTGELSLTSGRVDVGKVSGTTQTARDIGAATGRVIPGGHLGDYGSPANPVRIYFYTVDGNGVPVTLAGTPVVKVYEGASTTEFAVGITLTVDFDGRTGFHQVSINPLFDGGASGTYQDQAFYAAVLTAGTVNGVSVVGTVVGTWTNGLDSAWASYLQASNASSAATAAVNAIGTPTGASIAADIAGVITAIDAIPSGIGPGADEVTLTFTSNGVAVPDADLWVTSDADGATVVEGPHQSDSNGRATFMLDAGSSYYFWAQKDGENPIRGQAFIAVAD